MKSGKTSKRGIGDAVAPPKNIKKKSSIIRSYPSGLTIGGIKKHVYRRLWWFIGIMLGTCSLVYLAIFVPFVLTSMVSGHLNISLIITSFCPLILLIGMLAIIPPISMASAMKRLGAMIPRNRVDIMNDRMRVTFGISTMVLPRQVEIPFELIKEISVADNLYLDNRKAETKWYHKMMNYRFKPRAGDYFHLYTDLEDLMIISLRSPMRIPYFDYKWTGSEKPNMTVDTSEFVVNVDRKRHMDFKIEALDRSRAW